MSLFLCVCVFSAFICFTIVPSLRNKVYITACGSLVKKLHCTSFKSSSTTYVLLAAAAITRCDVVRHVDQINSLRGTARQLGGWYTGYRPASTNALALLSFQSVPVSVLARFDIRRVGHRLLGSGRDSTDALKLLLLCVCACVCVCGLIAESRRRQHSNPI